MDVNRFFQSEILKRFSVEAERECELAKLWTSSSRRSKLVGKWRRDLREKSQREREDVSSAEQKNLSSETDHKVF
jgi:hypothetical protein